MQTSETLTRGTTLEADADVVLLDTLLPENEDVDQIRFNDIGIQVNTGNFFFSFSSLIDNQTKLNSTTGISTFKLLMDSVFYVHLL